MADKKYKVILNIAVARYLLKKGFIIKDVKPSVKIRGRVAFVFELTPELKQTLLHYSENKK
ncbi:DUF5659 domain-containing protein [Virgibacillus proomii]|uniref:DUF5659 domain-containing protein n=1 Tax=Virgibacillus proomii TaxID=84407 RepID=UPI001C1277FF|nr:DUF5659 domain-containing protein [Virgibacillus proomii]MBU5265725.1 hypothetical protein [Virgibacillus proomii]